MTRRRSRELAATGARLVGESLTAHEVFGWRQPFRARRARHAARCAQRGRRGVVLVHGFVCNRGFWNPWMPRLRAAGVPFVAVNLEPVFGSTRRLRRIIDDAVAAA